MNILKRIRGNSTQPTNGDALTLYYELIAVMDSLPQLRQEDYDLAAVKARLILPVAQYLAGQNPEFLKPLFISGAPGIGKTTLLMILDEALYRLGSGNCRDMLVSGQVTGYFADKPPLHVTPLNLFGTPTALLSARDWNNILRHWTFDEAIADHSGTALLDLIQLLRGKVVMVDEAELEGYVYFSELLAQHGVLVILSSNLAQDHIHLAPDHVRVVTLHGRDHRYGDISRVCLSNAPHELFDQFAHDHVGTGTMSSAKISRAEIDGSTVVYLRWSDLKNQPLMKDDFARCFRESGAEAVLLDSVPFFAEISAEAVDLAFLGHLSRFVNFVDAIHDCGLPLLIRGTQPDSLDVYTAEDHLLPVLTAYDERTGSHYGQAAWIEWTRCLSRLRSREAINAAIEEHLLQR